MSCNNCGTIGLEPMRVYSCGVWIDVNESLPEIDQWVIVRSGDDMESIRAKQCPPSIYSRSNKRWAYSLCDHCERVEQVTHWLPLPPLPERDKDEMEKA